MNKVLVFFLLILPCYSFGQGVIDSEKIQTVLDKSVDGKFVHGVTMSIWKGGNVASFAAGNMEINSPYFIASVSKLYTSSIIFALADQGKLSLDDSIRKWVQPKCMSGLHTYKGVDYSDSIRVYHLFTNTSGLSDYFEQKNEEGSSIRSLITSGTDTALGFDQMIELTKALPKQFAPGAKGKAYYSDSNFQLLGKIIENVTGKSISEAYQSFVFSKIGVGNTYLYEDPGDTLPSKFYMGSRRLDIPKMMASFSSDGGIVSTSEEGIAFLTSFFNGVLFAPSNLRLDSDWNKIYSPFQYGWGIQKFKFPGMPELIGHAGATGSFAYFVPSQGIYLCGTVNQLEKPQLAYRMIAKVLASLK